MVHIRISKGFCHLVVSILPNGSVIKGKVMSAIPEADRSKEWKKVDFKRDILPVKSVFRVLLNTTKDCFLFNGNIQLERRQKEDFSASYPWYMTLLV